MVRNRLYKATVRNTRKWKTLNGKETIGYRKLR